MSVNFAKFIYQILEIKWTDKRPIPLKTLQDCVRKANKHDIKLLQLLYGNVGAMSTHANQEILTSYFQEQDDKEAAKKKIRNEKFEEANRNSKLAEFARQYEIPDSQVNKQMVSRSHRVKDLVVGGREDPSKFKFEKPFTISGPIPKNFKVTKIL